MLSDYKFSDCSVDQVTSEQLSSGSWICVMLDKTPCSMSSGGVHLFSTALQAEVFGRQLLRGWTGGTFLEELVEVRQVFK